MVALLWSLFLVVGADLKQLHWLLGKIASCTTDMGTEYGLPDVPDIIATLLAYHRGMMMSAARELTNMGS